MARQTLYTNADNGKSVLSYFMANAGRCETAQLACPSFTTVEPLTILKEGGVKHIKLIVRLCYATMPDVLETAANIPGVAIRYFASDVFHAKFYILRDVALLGSANLTNGPGDEPRDRHYAA